MKDEGYTRDEIEDISRVLLFALHLQATEAGNGDGFCTRTIIPKDIWDMMFDGEILFSTIVNEDGDVIITTQTKLPDEIDYNEFV
jgi:hypothetical protein